MLIFFFICVTGDGIAVPFPVNRQQIVLESIVLLILRLRLQLSGFGELLAYLIEKVSILVCAVILRGRLARARHSGSGNGLVRRLPRGLLLILSVIVPAAGRVGGRHKVRAHTSATRIDAVQRREYQVVAIYRLFVFPLALLQILLILILLEPYGPLGQVLRANKLFHFVRCALLHHVDA